MSETGEHNELVFREVGPLYEDQYAYSGLFWMRNEDEDNPWILPTTTTTTWNFLTGNFSVGRFEDGRLILNHGIINGWVDYEIVSVRPNRDKVDLLLQDGELYEPSVALRKIRGSLTNG